ncbi:hypothetical protein HYQ46_004306 [Verticillium longisporum]|nr:hypothetical protein HYQ46_004306 [Verticillium longisporum]
MQSARFDVQRLSLNWVCQDHALQRHARGTSFLSESSVWTKPALAREAGRVRNSSAHRLSTRNRFGNARAGDRNGIIAIRVVAFTPVCQNS